MAAEWVRGEFDGEYYTSCTIISSICLQPVEQIDSGVKVLGSYNELNLFLELKVTIT